ncbi:hypothetical protein [Anaerosphaera multitolerans]|uniref:Regulatory protein YycH domain-containing protein n=1 Tax=Anaerosphaera multitolerans TaxID=2487351 RepID=A0A437S963_9FIRM|nr:hypothetical protein [Anaerosphaera multitolerans]RVU55649.1 hypothetical protein EF514_00080 [Anaerosphaera multitolerans]
MKKKDILLNIVLVLLVALTIFQSSYLWFSFPKSKDSGLSEEIYNPEELFIEILKPKKLIVNFGEHRHTVLHNFDDIYREYLDTISMIYNETKEEDLISITLDEYLELQQQRSIVFEFNKVVTGNIFRNLLGFSNNENNETENIPIEKVYISNSEIIIGNNKGYFRTKVPNQKNISNTLSYIEGEGYNNYNNFYELYGIKKNLYYPQKNIIPIKDVYFSSSLLNEEDIREQNKIKNTLAERFLNQNIDYIRETTQDNGTRFDYDGKVLTVTDNSIIIFQDSSNFEAIERNLYISLKRAINFIANKVGIPEDLYISSVNPIKDGDNLGYKITFNLTDNSVPIVVDDEEMQNYIELEVYLDHVKSYRQVYRQTETDPDINYENTRILPLETIVSNNKVLFVNDESTKSTEDIILNISDINLVYLYNSASEDENKLDIAMEIDYEKRTLFFSLESGKFIMER